MAETWAPGTGNPARVTTPDALETSPASRTMPVLVSPTETRTIGPFTRIPLGVTAASCNVPAAHSRL